MAHICHAVECCNRVPPRMLMCIKHWRMVPKWLQSEVWRTYVPGQETRKDPTSEYLAAHHAAVGSVAGSEGRYNEAVKHYDIALGYLRKL